MQNNDFSFIESAINEVFDRQSGWANDYSKRRSVVEPRQVAHWAMYYFTKYELKNISFYFGRRAHDVVIHSVRVVNGRLQTDYEFACRIRTLVDYMGLNGFKLQYKYGRVLLTGRVQPLHYTTNYAHKPKQRKVELVVRPNLVDRLIRDRNQFLAEYESLQHKKRRIARINDFDKVIQLAREISVLETSVKTVAKHVI